MNSEKAHEFRRVQGVLRELNAKLIRLEEEFSSVYGAARQARDRLHTLRREIWSEMKLDLGDEGLDAQRVGDMTAEAHRLV